MDQPDGNRIGGSGQIALAIIAAAFIFGFTSGGDEPRYQLAASGSAVYRMNSDSGEIIACTASGCVRVEEPDRAKQLGSIGLRLPGGAKPDRAEDKKALPEGN